VAPGRNQHGFSKFIAGHRGEKSPRAETCHRGSTSPFPTGEKVLYELPECILTPLPREISDNNLTTTQRKNEEMAK